VSPFDKPILLKINKDFLRLYLRERRYWCWYW